MSSRQHPAVHFGRVMFKLRVMPQQPRPIVRTTQTRRAPAQQGRAGR